MPFNIHTLLVLLLPLLTIVSAASVAEDLRLRDIHEVRERLSTTLQHLVRD